MHRDQVVSIQIAAHRGWHARVGDRTIDIANDGVGHMYVAPACEGSCTIELNYDGGTEMTVAWGLFWIGWIVGGVGIGRSLWSRFNASRKK